LYLLKTIESLTQKVDKLTEMKQAYIDLMDNTMIITENLMEVRSIMRRMSQANFRRWKPSRNSWKKTEHRR
jgi:hypothetical protein